MSVFGPKYPPGLQRVIDHAERFCQNLSRCEAFGRGVKERARLWLLGRTGEVEELLQCVLWDWEARRVSLEEAAESIRSYVEDLHTAARATLGLEGELDCCCDEVFLTEMARVDVDKPSARTVGEPMTHDTWFEPSAVLLELQAESEGPWPSIAEARGRPKVQTQGKE